MFKSYPERTIYLDDFLTAVNNNRWIKINKEISSGTENIDVLYLNESDDMEWIEDTNDPWENIDQELINKLTDEERNLIEDAFEGDRREHGNYDCDPIYKITSMEFDDEEDRDEWDLFIGFEVTCEEGSNKGINYITLYINRDTGGWYMA